MAIFLEHRITIASIVMAVGMAISTLVLALTGGGGSVPAPAPSPKPSDKGNLKEWVKKHLQTLGNLADPARERRGDGYSPYEAAGRAQSWHLSLNNFLLADVRTQSGQDCSIRIRINRVG